MSDLHRTPSNGHPDGLLAALVDGTLTTTEDVEVRSHLDGCERCREELRLARSARAALLGLAEIEPPWGLGRAAIEEARSSGRVSWRRRATAGLAAAAAIALVVGLSVAVLQNGAGKDAGRAAPAPSGAERGSSASPNAPSEAGVESSGPTVVHQDTNYSKRSIEGLARAVASSSKEGAPPEPTAAVQSPAQPTASAPPQPSPIGSGSMAGDVYADDPVACLNRARDLPAGSPPVEIIEARFEGRPALIGIYRDEPARSGGVVSIWVAASDCSLLHYAYQRIP